jgi:hypothetical protein
VCVVGILVALRVVVAGDDMVLRRIVAGALITSSTSGFSSQLLRTQLGRPKLGLLSSSLDDDGDFDDDDFVMRGREPAMNMPPQDLTPNGIGVGTMAWGDPDRGCFERYGPSDLQEAYDVLVEGGVTFFETVRVYFPVSGGIPVDSNGRLNSHSLSSFFEKLERIVWSGEQGRRRS